MYNHTLAPIDVPSATTIGKTYRVSVEGCECDGWKWRGHCRHHDAYMADVASLAAAYRCRNCQTEPAMPGRAFCQGCMNLITWEAERGALAVAETFVPFCHCCRCGAEYPFSDDSPLYCGSCAPAASVAA